MEYLFVATDETPIAFKMTINDMRQLNKFMSIHRAIDGNDYNKYTVQGIAEFFANVLDVEVVNQMERQSRSLKSEADAKASKAAEEIKI